MMPDESYACRRTCLLCYYCYRQSLLLLLLLLLCFDTLIASEAPSLYSPAASTAMCRLLGYNWEVGSVCDDCHVCRIPISVGGFAQAEAFEARRGPGRRVAARRASSRLMAGIAPSGHAQLVLLRNVAGILQTRQLALSTLLVWHCLCRPSPQPWSPQR
jgi:hypothetical protein